MKRMIDGIINYSVKKGKLIIPDGNSAIIGFVFPLGYYPLSLSSKLLSMLPGRIKWGDDTSDIKEIFFNSTSTMIASSIAFYGGQINHYEYGENRIDYTLTFADGAKRDEFVKSLFGEGVAIEDGDPEFSVPVSMILVPFSGSMEL